MNFRNHSFSYNGIKVSNLLYNTVILQNTVLKIKTAHLTFKLHNLCILLQRYKENGNKFETFYIF